MIAKALKNEYIDRNMNVTHQEVTCFKEKYPCNLLENEGEG